MSINYVFYELKHTGERGHSSDDARGVGGATNWDVIFGQNSIKMDSSTFTMYAFRTILIFDYFFNLEDQSEITQLYNLDHILKLPPTNSSPIFGPKYEPKIQNIHSYPPLPLSDTYTPVPGIDMSL